MGFFGVLVTIIVLGIISVIYALSILINHFIMERKVQKIEKEYIASQKRANQLRRARMRKR